MALRTGLPLQVDGPLVWSGQTDKLDYILKLDHRDIEDIENAVNKFKGLTTLY